MRRVAMLALTIGLTLAGIAGAAAVRPAAASAGPGVAAAQAAHWLGAVPAKTVSYRGYLLTVPADWPVYRLGRGSRQCVRYDRHAVYLGQPGADQLCPAHLAGRVDTISVQAGRQPGYAPGAWGAAPGVARRGGLRQAAHLMMDAQDHQLLATAGRSGLTVDATYASSSALVDRIIASVRPAAGSSSPPGQPAASHLGQPAAGQPGQPAVVPEPGQPAAAPVPGQSASGSHGALGRGQHRLLGVRRGFDTCSAPSLRTMIRWRRAYSAMAIYIGGPEAACGLGNLSPAWVRAVTRMGWALIPTYVGRQATCNKIFRVRIRLRHAFPEGRAAAEQAIGLAAALGLGRHAPIYDDMEYYHHQWGRCRRGVLSFLNGWTRQLHASGHRSGVYSSASAAVTDLARTSTVYGHRLAKPDSIWFGLWDGRPTLSGLPYLPPSMWRAARRIKQWRGPHWRRIGGVTLGIDGDLVAGAVYRLPAVPWPGCGGLTRPPPAPG